jgi:branched-chain amino acid transport system ATP-binding protein
MTGETLLEVRDLSAGYNGAAVLRRLNLEVRSGEVVALLGLNGAGKTTTLRVISGLLRPMQGSVCFIGRNVPTLAPQRLARLGLVHVPENRGDFSPTYGPRELPSLRGQSRRTGYRSGA